MIHCKTGSDGQFRILKKPTRYYIGSTSVAVNIDSDIPNVALICCDSKVWRVVFDDRLYSDPVLNRIWFTDVDDVCLFYYTTTSIKADRTSSHIILNHM